jgi:NTE family protein
MTGAKGKTALVFSAGGMFGAYQAGAWSVLERVIRPDVVIGASAGALNAWAVAGGCSGDDLIRTWMELDWAAELHWRMPRRPLDGVLEPDRLHRHIRELHASYPPRREVGIVLTDLLRLRPFLVRGANVTWRHLAASCAVPGIMQQQRLEGRLCTDGGLLCSLPLWAASAMEATQIAAINALPFGVPSRVIRWSVRSLRWIARYHPGPAPPVMIMIRPRAHLGTSREALAWARQNAARWIEQGQADALAGLAALEDRAVECRSQLPRSPCPHIASTE